MKRSIVRVARLVLIAATLIAGSVVGADPASAIGPPVIAGPADVTLDAPASTGPDFTGAASAIGGDGLVFITSSDVITPGSCPANYTIVRTWRATDSAGNEDTVDQTITVQDVTPPTLTLPTDVTVIQGESTAPGATGSATAGDEADPSPTVSFSDSGNITRTWTATDWCGNSVSADQTITVLTPQEALEILRSDVESLGLPRGTENSLTKKLSNAIRNLDTGDNTGASDKLKSFIDVVKAQTGKKIPAGDAPHLIALAQRILRVI